MNDATKKATVGSESAVERFVMPADAVALQPVRFMPGNELRYYTATTFLNNPRGGCGMYYQRCRVAGGIAEHGTSDEVGLCDVLNDAGDIVADFSLTRKGLKFLNKTLGCRVEA